MFIILKKVEVCWQNFEFRNVFLHMNASCSYIPYQQTNAFSKIALDYLAGNEQLSPFYQHTVSIEGMEAAIAARKQYPTNRKTLVAELRKQYDGYELTQLQEENLSNLLNENTFTITTAHQPNIFTGHLYFVYKILHAIKLALFLKQQLPQYHFVPVYYMGSEDADLDELGHIFINGEKLEWQTDQRGAIGRMNTKGLDQITKRLEGEFGHLPYGKEMIQLCQQAYEQHSNIQEATLYLVNELFKEYGLLILIPDNTELKRLFEPVVKKELTEQFSNKLVSETTQRLSEHYKVQAGGREVNLFYLDDSGARERIEAGTDTKTGQKRYYVTALEKIFTESEILDELHRHPKRFSANVILRGVFQEMILPNIAFIGGGGELAYWLELKEMFNALQVPYPVLILRNSFLILDKRVAELVQKLQLTTEQLFLPEKEQLQILIEKNTVHRLKLDTEAAAVNEIYTGLQQTVAQIDPTLQAHVAALHARMLQQLHKLENKMLKAEKRHHTDRQRQLQTIRKCIVPNNNLQERINNFLPLYALYGKELLAVILQNSFAIEKGFSILNLETGICK